MILDPVFSIPHRQSTKMIKSYDEDIDAIFENILSYDANFVYAKVSSLEKLGNETLRQRFLTTPCCLNCIRLTRKKRKNPQNNMII